MKQEKRRHPTQKTSDEQLLDSVFRSGSATDCTGLIPNTIQSHQELENYDDMYTFLPKAVRDHESSKKGLSNDLPCANGGSVEKPD